MDQITEDFTVYVVQPDGCKHKGHMTARDIQDPDKNKYGDCPICRQTVREYDVCYGCGEFTLQGARDLCQARGYTFKGVTIDPAEIGCEHCKYEFAGSYV